MFNLDHAKRLVILSAEQSAKGAAFNANATEQLRQDLAAYLATGHAVSVIKCDGQYKGTPETSFAVICGGELVQTLATLAGCYAQECILVAASDADITEARLVYMDRRPDVGIGELKLCQPGQEYDASTTIGGTNIAFHFA